MNTVVRIVCWIIVALGIAVMVGGLLTACSESPTAAPFEGQGLSFEQAADRAVADFWNQTEHQIMWWGFVGQQVCFHWDDNGKQADGCVSLLRGGWFVPPYQAGPTAMLELRSVADLREGMVIEPNLPLDVDRPAHCDGWYVSCRVVGWDDSCGKPFGCPVMKCTPTCEWPYGAPE